MNLATHGPFVVVIVAALLVATTTNWPYSGLIGWTVAVAALIAWVALISARRSN